MAAHDLADVVEQLAREVQALRAEAEARRVLGRYMWLCDTPLPEYGMSEEERACAIGELFTEDAVWEGVGGTHGAQFGSQVGPQQIADHMRTFHRARDPERVFNTHYVCTEQVRATPDGAEGTWTQFQPWVFDDGRAVLRSSRISVRFRPTETGWKISRYRTESLFVADLPAGAPSSMIEKSVLTAPDEGNPHR
jgi:hypothetical protein